MAEEAEEKEIRKIFDKIDINNDHRISVTEIRKASQLFGCNPTLKEAKEMIAEVDKDDSGFVEFDEFLKLMRGLVRVPEVEKQSLMEAFKFFDKDGSGYINADELRKVVCGTGEQLTDTEIEEMMQEADVDGDGKISYEEFVCILVGDESGTSSQQQM